MLFAEIVEPYYIGESHDVAAIFKPRGWHSIEQDRSGDSIVEWLRNHLRELPDCELTDANQEGSSTNVVGDGFLDELGMLYRLDFETSGIMLFALTRSAFERMKRAQDQMALEKRYVLVCSESSGALPGSMPPSRTGERAALVQGICAGREKRVESYFRGYGKRGARVACIAPEFLPKTHKKTAKSLYETLYHRGLRLESDESIALLGAGAQTRPLILAEVSIRRGFRHQIRAHNAWLGLPIIGDALYGGTGARRLMLEAFSVALLEGRQVLDEWRLHAGIAGIKEVMR